MTTELNENILCIDIGGSRIKAIVLNGKGEELTEYKKIETPASGKPSDVIENMLKLTQDFKPYEKVSVGFPGYVKNGMVLTAPNLGNAFWNNIPFKAMLEEKLMKPVRLLNDADMQGLGIAQGKGFEIVVTLGTGFGTALLMNGNLLPHIELAHHPFSKDREYDEYIGNRAVKDLGEERWNKRLQKVITSLRTVFNYDHLYIGGGNAKKINFPLENNISIVNNKAGIKGGAKLWQHDDRYGIISTQPTT